MKISGRAMCLCLMHVVSCLNVKLGDGEGNDREYEEKCLLQILLHEYAG